MKTKIRKLNFIAAIITILIVGTMASCSKSDSNPPLPKIGPYDSSAQVASANLLAYWSFDGTNNEIKSGTAPSTSTGASFITGVKGQALSLSNGYLLYPTIPALSSANAISSVTVSMWVNVDNNGAHASSFLALTQTTANQTDWNTGPLNVYAETGRPLAFDDTLLLHSAFHTWTDSTNYSYGGDNINDGDAADRGTTFKTVLGTKKWVHYVMRYDGTGSNIDLFANGVLVSNSKYRNRVLGTAGLGPIVINGATQVVIGGWPNSDAGYTNSPVQVWQSNLTGSIDQIRIYNIAMQDADIGYLYQLELAGR